MANNESVIMTCAVTGGIHTPTMSPYLPITPSQIIDASVGATPDEARTWRFEFECYDLGTRTKGCGSGQLLGNQICKPSF